jgi:hypothetical protein
MRGSDPDPIFAVIEAHRAAQAAYGVAIDEGEWLESENTIVSRGVV